ncbi:MAG: aldolase [Alphaproteobacteria bacterium]|nr:aldolase [Alphaproteobacteria bacterium]
MTAVNHVKKKLAEGKIAAGLTLRIAQTVEMTFVAKQAGFDWLFLDMEHGSMAVHHVGQLSIAAAAAGVTPIARVTHQDMATACRLLDAGAQGIVFPHVDTAEEAHAIVEACRFAPQGKRSFGGMPPSLGFAPMSPAEVTKASNELVFLIVMIETEKAVANVDAIAAVPGIDCLLIGSNDLTLDMGITGDYGHAKVVGAYEALVAACKKHGKVPGMGGIYDTVHAKRYIQMGCRFLLGGSDLALLSAAAKARAEFFGTLL